MSLAFQLVEHARGVNLLHQFWIHTAAIQRLDWVERVFNTPSHHRVHNGSNRQYLDSDHGSILLTRTSSSAPSRRRTSRSSTA